MKNSVFCVSASMIFVMLFTFNSIGSPKHSGISGTELMQSIDLVQIKDTVAQKVVYTCPMHSEIAQDKPGKCSKCGMNLTKSEVVKAVYTCPMHSEVIQDKSGKCPKCGMNLVEKSLSKVSYTCPMHPEVLKEMAGKCPKCGMDLAKKATAKK